jgi:predicted ATP-binding protein involved in virulence
MFDPEQYNTNNQYHSTNQTAFLPYIYPSYRPGLHPTSNDRPDSSTCKWIDPDTNQICNRTFSCMQDIGNNKNNKGIFQWVSNRIRQLARSRRVQ